MPRFRSLLLLASLAAAGCGGADMGSVEGTVMLGGKPVQGAEVTFEPVGSEGATAIGYTNAEGHYALQSPGRQAGAAVGDYVVRIGGGEAMPDAVGPPLKIPAKYNAESDMKRTVAAGSNEFDFEL